MLNKSFAEEDMQDYKDYLQEKKLVLKIKEEIEKPKNVLQSRNHLLSKARGSIRQYLQQQIIEAIHRTSDEKAPQDPNQIV